MGEIRIVSPDKTRGYPYPVCKTIISLSRAEIFLSGPDTSALAQKVISKCQALLYSTAYLITHNIQQISLLLPAIELA